MNIPSYVVTFPATTARNTFFGTPTGPTQPSLFRYEPRHEETNVVVPHWSKRNQAVQLQKIARGLKFQI